MIYKKGFTLIELMVGVSIIAILASTGAAIFSRSLQGTSSIELRRSIDDRARVVTNSMSRFLREGRVVSLTSTVLGVQDRTACLSSGSVTGDSLIVKALDGLDTTFSVTNVGGVGIISSASAQTVQINPETVSISHQTGLAYYFKWYCSVGIPDRLVMYFKASVSTSQGDTTLTADYNVDVTMRNSGQ